MHGAFSTLSGIKEEYDERAASHHDTGRETGLGTAVEAFQASLRGALLRPGDEGYEPPVPSITA